VLGVVQKGAARRAVSQAGAGGLVDHRGGCLAKRGRHAHGKNDSGECYQVKFFHFYLPVILSAQYEIRLAIEALLIVFDHPHPAMLDIIAFSTTYGSPGYACYVSPGYACFSVLSIRS
jgi:hypothetical protein